MLKSLWKLSIFLFSFLSENFKLDPVLFEMSGFGGNAILIDVETSTIVAVNFLHYTTSKALNINTMLKNF